MTFDTSISNDRAFTFRKVHPQAFLWLEETCKAEGHSALFAVDLLRAGAFTDNEVKAAEAALETATLLLTLKGYHVCTVAARETAKRTRTGLLDSFSLPVIWDRVYNREFSIEWFTNAPAACLFLTAFEYDHRPSLYKMRLVDGLSLEDMMRVEYAMQDWQSTPYQALLNAALVHYRIWQVRYMDKSNSMADMSAIEVCKDCAYVYGAEMYRFRELPEVVQEFFQRVIYTCSPMSE